MFPNVLLLHKTIMTGPSTNRETYRQRSITPFEQVNYLPKRHREKSISSGYYTNRHM